MEKHFNRVFAATASTFTPPKNANTIHTLILKPRGTKRKCDDNLQIKNLAGPVLPNTFFSTQVSYPNLLEAWVLVRVLMNKSGGWHVFTCFETMLWGIAWPKPGIKHISFHHHFQALPPGCQWPWSHSWPSQRLLASPAHCSTQGQTSWPNWPQRWAISKKVANGVSPLKWRTAAPGAEISSNGRYQILQTKQLSGVLSWGFHDLMVINNTDRVAKQRGFWTVGKCSTSYLIRYSLVRLDVD